MPLKLVAPRAGKSPNFTIRGTYLGIYVERTAGTPDRAKARQVLNGIKKDIEGGAFKPRKGLTFAGAAMAYIRAGGDDRFVGPLNDHFGDTPADDIRQAQIDEAADTLYPNETGATRNRQVYTPISAILKHNGFDFALKRPKGAQGEERVDWLWPEQADRLLDAAEFDPEFAIFLTLLLYCGPRLSEALRIKIDDVRLSESFAFIGKTKNGQPRPVHLPPVVVAALANHPSGLDRASDDTVFRFRKNGHLYNMWKKARADAAIPGRMTFHTLRHTWATWMRRYAKLDTKGLVATGAWADEKSAARYEHVIVSEEATRSDLLPTRKRGKSVESVNK
jgi:integrase